MGKNRERLISVIKKQQVAAAVSFAINNISDVDEKTLRRFWDLISVTEDSELVEGELLEKMRLLCQYIPHSCHYSLLVLTKILEMRLPTLANSQFHQKGMCVIFAPAGMC